MVAKDKASLLLAGSYSAGEKEDQKAKPAGTSGKERAQAEVLWDSGKVVSEETINVPYDGKALTSGQCCVWHVKVWDKDGQPSGWSEPASWSMGLLEESDWKAEYVSFRDYTPVYKDPKLLFLPPARQYRKEFEIKKPIRRAMIYSTALGIYELHLNGERVGEEYFAPGWSDYKQRAYYNSHDVTSLLRNGTNALGAWVADGWYAGYVGFGYLTGIGTERIGRYSYGKTPAVMVQLDLEYDDGSREVIASGKSWKVSGDGPIQFADLLMGELYDARKEMKGWSKPGFDDRQWEPAILAAENGDAKATVYEFKNSAPGVKPVIKGHEENLGFKRPPRLEAFPGAPVKRVQEIKPIRISSPAAGIFIFDLGQNIAGVARLKVKGKAGTRISMRYGERLHADGRLMTENLRNARATDDYILRGDSDGETYTPRFTYHGFQYVELTGYPGKPELDAITGIVLHSDTPLASSFECSDAMVNRLFTNIVWTQRANFLDVPTDCPQRDERFGWLGDGQLYARSATYIADVGAFYTKWLREVMEAQRPNGVFPSYAPFPYQHEWDFASGWCDGGVIIPWTMFKAYGDTNIIQRCWEPMTRFLNWRKSESKDFLGVVHGNQWGDWLALNERTPVDYIDTVYFAHSAKLMSEMARAIGKSQEASEYQALFQKIQAAFTNKYVKADGTLTVDTQTAYALAVRMGLLPEGMRVEAALRLATQIRSNDTLLATGYLGSRDLLPALSDGGQHDLAVRLLQSRRFPSWGYQVELGATTIWERWDSLIEGSTRSERKDASMNSFSHPCLGSVCEWMFSHLAGIDCEDAGWKRLIIRPMPPTPGSNPEQKPIYWVNAHYDSIRGRIATGWKRTEKGFELEVTIPANTQATLYLPAREVADIRESGKPVSDSEGVRLLRLEGKQAVLAVPSGTYHFSTGL
jgi:alpha-L-rhamnosidase